MRHATIADVARAAGVSNAAVSRYLNHTLKLPAETGSRIDRAVLKLKYRPNRSARGLKRGRTDALGLVVPDVANPFYGALASYVELEAEAAGFSLTLYSSRNRVERELLLLEQQASRPVDGLIFLTNHGGNGLLSGKINAQDRIVVLDEDVPSTVVPKVFVDNERGGYEATRYLLEMGHRQIAHVTGPKNLLSVRERCAGYKRALREAGIELNRSLIMYDSYTPQCGRAAVDTFFRQRQVPTAIFASSDYLVVGILESLRDLNVTVPTEVSVIGFDDLIFTRLLDPPVTTVRQPIAELAGVGVHLLLDCMNGVSHRAEVIRLPVELIKRSSVSHPARQTSRLESPVRSLRSSKKKTLPA
ncbi:MAG: LacI family DNA-binding transcriptional regulator [Verrucomicrobia bacterium]|nr:LacI family DNA-binding transcriptional regulator [Verrucomicrobiota bacterium]MBV9672946.1 LacI family DNA-binding transcriptional regulator [Verrucomicrobiota bacterium]